MKISLLSTIAVIVFGLAIFAMAPGPSSAETETVVPAPAIDETASAATETAVFAGGCFWGVQGVFQHVEGVKNAVSGYAGGAKETAEYEKVGSGRTGHAEAVKITYDPSKITYGRLLQIYFSVAHDPTQLNRQGPDSGTQYRSTVFPANEEQAKVAKAYVDQLNVANTYGKKLATTIEMSKPFYAAEAYHQDYLTLNPHQPYIVYNDLPKVEALKQMFPTAYRAKPVLVSEAGL
jgi:peptide-methionine (S)-S-oxide reductase